MKFLVERKHEVISGVLFGLLLALALLGETIKTPQIYASSVETQEESTENLTDYQLQQRERNQFAVKYANSLKQIQEDNKGRESLSVIYTDREGVERWGGYVSGSRDWSNWDNVDYTAAKERDISTSIKSRMRARTQPMDRSLTRYNRNRLSSSYTRVRDDVSTRHFRLKTFANIGEVNNQPFPKLDYSNYYSSADRRVQKKEPTRTAKPKRLWQILLDHKNEKKK